MPPTAAIRAKAKTHSGRSRFVDDQAAGQCSPSPADSLSQSSPDVSLHVSNPRRAAEHASSSSDSDRPLAGKRHRSASLQRPSQRSDGDSDSLSNDDIAARAVRQHSSKKPGGSQDKTQRKRSKPRLDAVLGIEPDSMSGKPQSHDQALPSSRQHHQQRLSPGNAAAQDEDPAGLQDPVDSDDMPLADEPTLHSTPLHEEEEGPAFEMPSQMPRELQSWAWDK